MDILGVIFKQVSTMFNSAGIKLDELNFIIDLKNNRGQVTGFLEDVQKMNDPLDVEEMSQIMKLFINKLIKEYKKIDEKGKISKVYISLKLEIESYNVYLYIDENEQPIEFKF